MYIFICTKWEPDVGMPRAEEEGGAAAAVGVLGAGLSLYIYMCTDIYIVR